MRSVRFDLRVAISALAVAMSAIAAQPVMADVEEVVIIRPTELLPFEGDAPADVEVEFDFFVDHILFPPDVVGYRATITIGPLGTPVAQETFVYGISELPGPFTEMLIIPAGTPPGCYDLRVEVEELRGESLGGGVPCCGEFDEELSAVCIEASPSEDPTGVPVDIKPGSCPNPINTGKGGVIPAAIAGTAGMSVSDIDPYSVRLMGVEPLRFSYEDVATPFLPFIGKDADCLECTTARGDGIMDLTLKFDAQQVVAAIRAFYGDKDGELNDRDCLILFLTGKRDDGSPIVGEDVVRIQDKGQKGGADKGKSGKLKKSKPKKKK